MLGRRIRVGVPAYLILAISLVPSRAGAAEPFVIVSDVDDTVKITNVQDHVHAIQNARSRRFFAGMPELYAVMLGADANPERLMFLSAGLQTKGVRDFLARAKFPPHQLKLREFSSRSDWRNAFKSTLRFKSAQMTRIYGASKDELILIGDDTQSDPEVYAAFAGTAPSRVLAIYIHRISGRRLPDGCIPFETAFDIAVAEYRAHRLTEDDAAAVGRAVLDSAADTQLPHFQTCPVELTTVRDLPESLTRLKAEIESRLMQLCDERNGSGKGSPIQPR